MNHKWKNFINLSKEIGDEQKAITDRVVRILNILDGDSALSVDLMYASGKVQDGLDKINCENIKGSVLILFERLEGVEEFDTLISPYYKNGKKHVIWANMK